MEWLGVCHTDYTDLLVTIDGHQITRASSNKFGVVSNGWLEVTAPIVAGVFRDATEPEASGPKFDMKIDSQLYKLEETTPDTGYVSTDVVSALFIAQAKLEDRRQVSITYQGLLIAPSGGELDTYHRIGGFYCAVEDESADGLEAPDMKLVAPTSVRLV